MTDEELKSVPYLGNMKPYVIENAAESVEAPITQVDEGMKGTMADYNAVCIKETPIMDVFPYKSTLADA